MKKRLRWHATIEVHPFSREQTEILKGVGILLIVLHNFFHNLTPYVGENEFLYHSHATWRFLQTLIDNPLDALRAVFSYYGHFGVQVFVFFSAYGLAKKYRNKDINFNRFLRTRVNKVYLSFLICVAVYIILGLMKATFITSEKVIFWDSLLWKVLLISNFIPNQALMPVGPWWFLPFIFQFYLLFPIMHLSFQLWGNKLLLFLSVFFIFVELSLNRSLVSEGLNLNYTVLGHVPVLCMGIFLAAQKKTEIPPLVPVLALFAFVAGSFNEYAWVLQDLSFTILILSSAIMAAKYLPRGSAVSVPLTFFGGISFHLFLVNGFLRSPFHNFAETYNVWWIDNLAAVCSLAFSTLFALLLREVDKRIRDYAVKVAGR